MLWTCMHARWECKVYRVLSVVSHARKCPGKLLLVDLHVMTTGKMSQHEIGVIHQALPHARSIDVFCMFWL
jgi:hypothetical protein